MTRKYISNLRPGFKLEIPIKNDDDIYELLGDSYSELYEQLSEYIHDSIMSRAQTIVGRKPQGVFPNPGDIGEKLYSCCDDIYDKNIKNQLFLITEENGETISCAPISLPEGLLELGRECEVFAIETGTAILSRLKSFLQKGIWQIGVRCGNTIIKDLTLFHCHQIEDNGKKQWIDSNGEKCFPLIWFGLPNDKPEEEWSLYESKTTDWRSFWFNDFWCFDWNALLGGYDDYYTVWMFCECGMEEPEEDFDRVKSLCPIELSEEDTNEQLSFKINTLFNTLFKNRVGNEDLGALTKR